MKKIYQSEDGKIFGSERKALLHELKIKKTKGIAKLVSDETFLAEDESQVLARFILSSLPKINKIATESLKMSQTLTQRFLTQIKVKDPHFVYLNGYTIAFCSQAAQLKSLTPCVMGFGVNEWSQDGDLLFAGSVSGVTEEIAEKIVEWSEFDKGVKAYRNEKYDCWNCITAKTSFRALSDLPYCVITENK